MINEATMKTVNDGYGRCCARAGFWDKFYEIFFKSSPAIQEKFKNTDMKKQKEILRGSLSFVLMYAKDPNAAFAKTKLTDVGKVHSRSRHNISAGEYELWTKSLLATIRHFEGDAFTPAHEKAWREVLTPAIKLMQAQYEG